MVGATRFMTTADRGSWRRNTGFWLILALTAIVAAWFGICEMRANTVSFDGALNAQVAANLLTNGHYGIGYPNIHDFDHRIQTGPTVVLPVALSFALFGVGSDAAQLPSVVFFVLFLALVVCYAFRHAGAAGALLAVLLVLQTPQLVPIGVGVFGEIPALAFFLAALLLLDRFEESASFAAAAASGVFLGLSVLTKIVMLIPVVGVLLALLVGMVTRRNIHVRQWAGIVGGIAAPLAAFEAFKLAVLTPPLWLDWWTVMIHRVAGQGLPLGMPDTVGAVPKVETHLGILSHELNVPWWSVLLLIAAPTLVFVLLWRHERAARPPQTVPISVVGLWLAASLYLAWWLALTPTSRAWLRRVIDGLLLQEIMVAILVVWGARIAYRSLRDRKIGAPRDRLRIVVVGALTCLLFLGGGKLVGSNLPRLGMSMKPTPTREAIDAMVATMRSLPDEAVFYGKGWYRVPVVALLSGRGMSDFNRFPVPLYDQPLHHTYFVVDNHMLHYQQGEVDEVLQRTVNEPVYYSDVCALYRLDKVLPYAPLPKPTGTGELATSLRPKDRNYQFAEGLGPEAPKGRYSHAVSGYLLNRGGDGCLVVDIWPSPQGGENPRLEVRVDHQVVGSAELVVGRPWRQVIILGQDIDPGSPGSLVELWMFADWHPQRFSLWTSDKQTFVVREVGFVPCPETDD